MSEAADPVRAHYEAFNRGDVEGTLAPLAEDVEFLEEPDTRPDAGHYVGIDAVRRFFEDMRSATAEIAIRPGEFMVRGEKVVVPASLHGRFRETDMEAEVAFVHVWTVRDGRIVHLHTYRTMEQALAGEGLDA